MGEASKLLEYITVPQQQLWTSYDKLSLDIWLADKVVDPSPSLVDPTLLLKSEMKVIDLVLTLVDRTLPLKSEVKVVESISSPLDPILSSKSLDTEVVPLT